MESPASNHMDGASTRRPKRERRPLQMILANGARVTADAIGTTWTVASVRGQPSSAGLVKAGFSWARPHSVHSTPFVPSLAASWDGPSPFSACDLQLVTASLDAVPGHAPSVPLLRLIPHA